MNLNIDKILQFNGWSRSECILCTDISICYNVTMLHEQYTVYACCNVIPHLAMKYFKTDFQMCKNIIWGMEFEG